MSLSTDKPAVMLDKDSFIPYYVQIKHILLDRIRNGEYPENSLIPSESALAREFSVTRMTVRKALDELKRDGMIKTVRGKGSIVSQERIEQSLQRLYRFGREVGNTGIAAESQTVSKEVCIPPAEVRKKFHGSEHEKFYKIIRVRYWKGSPVSLEYIFIPCSVAPGLLSQPIDSMSLVDIFEKYYETPVEKATEYLSPRITDAYQSELLGIKQHSPVFQTERVTRAGNGLVIEYRMSIVRGDRVRFSAELY